MITEKTKVNEWYYTTFSSLICCDELQYENICVAHNEPQGCYFCVSDYSKPCECEI